MNVCFIGVGSIAKRHIRNLVSIASEEGIDVSIDCIRREINKPLPVDISSYIRCVFKNDDLLEKHYDIIFITNPTSEHYDTLMKYENSADWFFIEKPVFMTTEAIINDKTLYNRVYVACPLRYDSIIQYIKKNINVSDIISIRCICSSYLPDWRIGIDYRDNYSAHKDMGGGVKLDLIHEWDYIQYLFGTPINIHMLEGKKSDLEIDAEDIAIYVAEYPEMMVELHLDYFGRATRREIEIFTKEDTVIADLINREVRFLNTKEILSFPEDRDDYQKMELRTALNIFEGIASNENDLNRALTTLQLTEGIIRL